MFDFSKYNLQELQAMSDLLDYLREDAGADALSYFCGCSLLRAIKHDSLRLSRSILMSLEEQARDHEAAEAEKVDRIKQACVAGAPPAVKCCNIDRCGVCLTDCPYTDEPIPAGADEPAPDMFGGVGDALADLCAAGATPAEEPDELRDLRALVDTLSRCSDRLAALALVEDRHFAECSRTDVFNKMITLRNSNRSIMNVLADIRDHYHFDLEV